MGDAVRQLSVVGEQQQSAAVRVESTDGHEAGDARHQVTHGGAAAGVAHGGHHAGRLVARPGHSGGDLCGDPCAVHLDDVRVAVNLGANLGASAVDAHPSRCDELV